MNVHTVTHIFIIEGGKLCGCNGIHTCPSLETGDWGRGGGVKGKTCSKDSQMRNVL